MAADAAATYRQRHRVAFRLPGAIARVEPHPGRRPRTIRDEFGKIETPAPMARQPERGRRRTRQDQISPGAFGPGETAKLSRRSAPNEETPVSSAGPVLERASPFQNTIQPFDLMSRRHPLSSTRAISFEICFEKQIFLKALVTCRHQAAGNLLEARFTSSSWRPCGSSSQSSSLRSSPSSPLPS